MNSEPNEPADLNDDANDSESGWDALDDEFKFHMTERPEDVPDFVDRVLAHIEVESVAGDFMLEDVEFNVAAGVWLSPMGMYSAEDDPAPPAAGADMLAWANNATAAMYEAWGEPVVHQPKLVGSNQEPEGILDYLLVAQDFASADLWDRGALFVAVLMDWSGEPGASDLRQILMLLPREHIMEGMSALISDDGASYELLMRGEALGELRRRAWILSTAFGDGEARLRDTLIDATRLELVSKTGLTTVWIFTDDGRALLLIHDPESEFAKSAARSYYAEHFAGADLAEQGEPEDGEAASSSAGPSADELRDVHLLMSERMLDGVPDDLRACIAARGEGPLSNAATQSLEFGLLNDQPVPAISGVFWFDGEIWRLPSGLIELGKREGFGLDDFGLKSAVIRPYRLGGAFTRDVFLSEDPEWQSRVEQIFAACPFPEQPRPEGEIRLGYAAPSSSDLGEIVDDIARIAAAWWDRNPEDVKLGDDTFVLAGRAVGRDSDPDLIHTVLAQAEPWTVDALQDWTDNLIAFMNERWGEFRDIRVEDRNGVERRTPLSRVMRGTGLRRGSLWWVNGHAVVLLAGLPDPSYSTSPEVILVIARADTLIELFGRMSLWEVRLRARAVRNLAAIASVPEGETSPETEPPIAWDGPALKGSDIVPLATRGGLRTGNVFWVWHFTHDGRALLTSHDIGDQTGSFDELTELFAGVPEDLLTLVVDRDPGGLYPTLTREREPQGEDRLSNAQVLPNAQAVFFHDGHDWRASGGMRRQAYAASVAAATATQDVDADGVNTHPSGVSTVNPLTELYSQSVGVPQLQWALRAGGSLWSEPISEPEYARFVFSREVSLQEAEAAYIPMSTAFGATLLGDLNGFLDVVAVGPGYRGVLDAALSNTDPARRRELTLWLLGEGVDASLQLSFMTPINVLLENPTLEAADAVLLTRLLESSADASFGLIGARAGGYPLAQLCDRDADEAELMPLVDALLAADQNVVTAAAFPDGRSVLDYVRAGEFPHRHPRAEMLERLEASDAAHENFKASGGMPPTLHGID